MLRHNHSAKEQKNDRNKTATQLRNEARCCLTPVPLLCSRFTLPASKPRMRKTTNTLCRLLLLGIQTLATYLSPVGKSSKCKPYNPKECRCLYYKSFPSLEAFLTFTKYGTEETYTFPTGWNNSLFPMLTVIFPKNYCFLVIFLQYWGSNPEPCPCTSLS